MARRVFHSFHFDNDAWRSNQVRNIGTIECNKPCTSNEWEDVKKGGDKKIKEWIEANMQGKSCVVVLIGSQTSERPWVKYEIEKGWKDKKGILGIYIHNLLDQKGNASRKGANPFNSIKFENGKSLSSVIEAHEPPYTDSKKVYQYIADNITDWIDNAINTRNQYR